MAEVIRTSYAAIAPAITERIADVAGIPGSRVFWVARRRVEHYLGPWDVLLRPRAGISLDETTTGGGRWDTRVRRILDVAVRVGLAVDEAARDYQWLFADADEDTGLIGYFRAQEAIIDALHLFLPTDGDGNGLLAEPMRLVNDIDPLREEGSESVWGDGTLAFEMVYTLDLNTDGE